MSVDQTDVVDYIATNPESNVVKLIIFDPFDWSNMNEHLRMLGKKLDLYITFVETGQLLTCGHEPVPDAPDYLISVRYVYRAPMHAELFIAEMTRIVSDAGIRLEFAPADPDLGPKN